MQSIFQFHENPRIVAWVQRPQGRLALWLIASALFMPKHASFLVPVVLGLIMLWPERRLRVLFFASPLVALELFIGPLSNLASNPSAISELTSALPAVLLILTFFALSIVAARNFQALPAPVRRHPLITLHLLAWCLIFASWQVPPAGMDGTAWKVASLLLSVLPFVVWRCCYILLSGQRGSAKSTTIADHMIYALPVFGGTGVPYGKGYDYLKRFWAADPEALARSQLAGLKLLFLYWLWIIVKRAILVVAYGEYKGRASFLADSSIAQALDLGIPHLSDLIASSATAPPELGVAWISLLLALILNVLGLAIFGHLIIGALRLFGFNVFRNTYKPLLAESIVEFWNRYYYYFKELLLEFFFYPIYTRYFRGHQQFRVFAATMAAACIGNTYFHILRDLSTLQQLSFAEALAALAPRAFYTLLLGLGIYGSMMAEKRRRGSRSPETPGRMALLRRLRRIAGVWLFFALIGIWNTHGPAAEFETRTAFFFSLFGISF
jgi:hypothetical protein